MTRHRLRQIVAVALLANLWTSGTAPAQGAWSPEFDQPGLGQAGVCYAMCSYRGELVAGTRKPFFSDGEAAQMNYIARFDGIRWLPLGAGVDGIVHAVVPWRGDLYAGGSFRTAGGRPAANIARWDGTRWSPVAAGFDGEVRALAVFRDELFAAGMFQNSGNRSTPRIARLAAGGFADVGGGIHRTTYAPEVLCLLATATKLYAGGSFDRAGAAVARHIAAWDGTGWSGLGAGINSPGAHGIVDSLATFRGEIVAGGNFQRAGSAAVRNVASWDGTRWTALGPGLTNATYLAVVKSLMEYGGALYAGGTFIWIDEDTSPTAVPVHRFARWDGTRWSQAGGVTEGLFLPNLIAAMTVHDGRLFVGGDFTIAGSDPLPAQGFVSRFVAWFDGQRWGPAGRGAGLDAPARRLVPWNGGLVAVGGFTEAGSRPARSVAFFDGATWRSFGTFDQAVNDAVVFGNDLVVTGNFYRVDGQVLGGIVKYDGKTWSGMGGARGGSALAVYQGQLYAGGTGSPTRWNGTSWQTFGQPVYGSVSDLHVHGGRLYIGGTLSFGTARPNLLAFDGSQISIVGGGTDGSVSVMADYGGDLVVGGWFTRIGTVAADRLAAFDGRSFRPLGPGVRGAGTVLALAERGSSLYVGGNFNVQGGNSGSWLLRYDGAAMQPVAGAVDGVVTALLVDPVLDRLYVSGSFRSTGGGTARGLTAFEFTPQFRDLGFGLPGPLREPHLEASGLFMAGRDLRLDVSSARESTLALLVLGLQRLGVPFLGGVLVPSADVVLGLPTDRIGVASLGAVLPGNLPAGVTAYAQAWIADPSAPGGVTASNGLALRSH